MRAAKGNQGAGDSRPRSIRDAHYHGGHGHYHSGHGHHHGGRWYHGRYWSYGVGSCWRWTPRWLCLDLRY